MVDPVYGLNEYGKPKMLTENQTFARNFLTLLLGKPGFYPSLPTIGIDIGQYIYAPTSDISVEKLKSKIATQCKDFLPYIQDGNFDIVKTSKNGNTFLLFILPPINSKENAIGLGVTTDSSGKVIFKFVENATQLL